MRTDSNSKPFFALYAWMVSCLQLKNYDLLIYALIYSYSRTGKGAYQGSIEYICKRLGVSTSTVIRALNTLVSRGYISKTVYDYNGYRRIEYHHSETALQKRHITKSADNEGFASSGYFTVYDWMINEYDLSGHLLTVFALIYSFTANTGNFSGNNAYIARRLNMSSKQVSRVISELIERGLIYVKEKYNPKTRITVYIAINTYDNYEEGDKQTTKEEKSKNQTFIDQYNKDLEDQIVEIETYYKQNMSEYDFIPDEDVGLPITNEILYMTNYTPPEIMLVSQPETILEM